MLKTTAFSIEQLSEDKDVLQTTSLHLGMFYMLCKSQFDRNYSICIFKFFKTTNVNQQKSSILKQFSFPLLSFYLAFWKVSKLKSYTGKQLTGNNIRKKKSEIK